MSEVMTEEYTVSSNDVGTLHVGTDGKVSTTDGSGEKLILTLPVKEDTESVSHFISSLQDKTDVHGVKSVVKWADKYLNHVQLSAAMWNRLRSSVNRINGIRSTSQMKGDKKRSLRNTAETFYGSLSTPVLRTQCQAFGLNFDSYGSIDDVVKALVDKSVEVTLG